MTTPSIRHAASPRDARHPTRRIARRFAPAALALACATAAACSDDPTSPAVPDGDAVAAVADLFRRHDVVALQEAHELQEQGDFVQALLHHPVFLARVRTIVVEFGNQRFQAVADAFVAGTPVRDDSLRMIWRNNSTSPFFQWDAPMYEQFFRAVRAANRSLPAGDRIRVVLGDPHLDWELVRGPLDLRPKVEGRDTSFLEWVEREGYAKGRRTLVIAGGAHILKRPGPPPAGAAERPSIIEEMERRHPGSVFVVMPHIGFGSHTDSLEARLGATGAPALIPLRSHWLGDKDGGVLEAGAFVGMDGKPTNIYAGRPVRNYADAYLYLGPRASLTRSVTDPAVYHDPAYVAELDRRNRLRFGRPLDLEALRRLRGPRYHEGPPI